MAAVSHVSKGQKYAQRQSVTTAGRMLVPPPLLVDNKNLLMPLWPDPHSAKSEASVLSLLMWFLSPCEPRNVGWNLAMYIKTKVR